MASHVKASFHVGALPSFFPNPFGAGNYLVVTVSDEPALEYNVESSIPALELPPNCTLRLTILPSPAAGAKFTWEQVYMRLRFWPLSGPQTSEPVLAPLLTDSDGGDGQPVG